MKIAVLRTDFKHHGDNSGYKQILKFLKIWKIFGLDQNKTAAHEQRILQKYLWLYEFELWKYRTEIDILFVMYAEEFYRFSWRFLRTAKIVATFHMPPELLAKELFYGNQRGRMGQITHYMNKKRFKRLDAAIVTNINQKEILKKVMDEEKIHIIPLGVHIDKMKEFIHNQKELEYNKLNSTVITTGDWLRDWDFYFEIVKAMPDVNFVLVNRKLEDKYRSRLNDFPNITFMENITDRDLFICFTQAKVQFLPVQSIAGSNSMLQGLALGCPLVLTGIDASQFHGNEGVIELYETKSIESAIERLRHFIALDAAESIITKEGCFKYANDHSWESIALQTQQVFNLVYDS